MCLWAAEKAQAHSKVEGFDEQKRASKKAETANAGKQVCLSVWKLVVHRHVQDRTSSDRMVAPLYCGVDKVIFLHLLHLNMYLQGEGQTKAERKAEEVHEQKSAAHAEEAQTAIASKQVQLFVR